MTIEQLLAEKVKKLPAPERNEVLDFADFLLTRKPQDHALEEDRCKGPLSDEPFVGMWRDRPDMDDSSAWVRRLREQEWGGGRATHSTH